MSAYIPGFRPGKKPGKYRNVKTEADGIVFDSKAEAKRYAELKVMQRAQEIRWFSRQPSFLLPGEIRYRPDFIVCGADGALWVEDVKGYETPEFKLKRRLWDSSFPELPLVIVK